MSENINIEVNSEPIPVVEIIVDENSAQAAKDAAAAAQDVLDELQKEGASRQDNFSRTIRINASNLTPYTGSLEEKICQYINTLNYEKINTDADVWVEYDESNVESNVESLTSVEFLYHNGLYGDAYAIHYVANYPNPISIILNVISTTGGTSGNVNLPYQESPLTFDLQSGNWDVSIDFTYENSALNYKTNVINVNVIIE